MDRTLWAVAGGAAGCGLLLALAVARNERGFTQRFYAQRPPEESIEPVRRSSSPLPAARRFCPPPGAQGAAPAPGVGSPTPADCTPR